MHRYEESEPKHSRIEYRMDFKDQYGKWKEEIDNRLGNLVEDREPRSLYEPVEHILAGEGKRIRAVLLLLSCKAVGGSIDKALEAALSVEILHNFTLVHDDIMDKAATRRGRQTVHTKWDEGTAILVGDVMIGLAQQLLLKNAGGNCAAAIDAFSRGIIDVCEGQALDREFEQRNDVTTEEYLYMIAMKTGRLVEMAAEIGGLIGGGKPEHINALRAYARKLGLAFQIQDDLLDLIADEKQLGKEIGRDIIEGKRTYLVVQGIELVAEGKDRELLEQLLSGPGLPANQVEVARTMFQKCGILDKARQEVERYCVDALKDLEILPDSEARTMLKWFSEMLMRREN
ncbi:MAG: polyprenyl synthetase family protein [Ignavibacteriae bacterium]|nr:polyprenyl synthetase family protein [Ignavibacteriota bacterium]MCB9217609.1 polyprenyl synthetase family protein [Ignavibacteria bacterium]